jgi:very-short-patch-repair endonuclease
LRLISPDLWFDDVALAVMVHSRAHHLRDADWEGTVERDSELTAHGATVIAFTPRSIATEPARVLERIEQVYLTLSRSGQRRSAITMTPRGWGLSA